MKWNLDWILTAHHKSNAIVEEWVDWWAWIGTTQLSVINENFSLSKFCTNHFFFFFVGFLVYMTRIIWLCEKNDSCVEFIYMFFITPTSWSIAGGLGMLSQQINWKWHGPDFIYECHLYAGFMFSSSSIPIHLGMSNNNVFKIGGGSVGPTASNC